MLYLIAAWLGLLLPSSIAGITVLQALQGRSRVKQALFSPIDRCFITLWLGIVVLAVALLTLSLGLPLSPGISGIFILCSCVLALLSKQTRQDFSQLLRQMCSRSRLGWVIVSSIAVAAWMSRSVTWLDTGLYHYQVIQWLAQYGTVPGVTLLFGNFGFTSSWFALAAPFNPASVALQASTVGNGFVLLISIWHCCVCAQRIMQQQARFTDYFAFIFLFISLFSFLCIRHLSEIVVSASPDVPIIFLVGAIAWTILVTNAIAASESNGDRIHSSISSSINSLTHSATHFSHHSSQHFSSTANLPAIPLVLAAGAVTIKLTALPLLLVAIGFYHRQYNTKHFTHKPLLPNKIQRLLTTCSILMSFLTPMVAASIITSGCPLYPSSLFCLALPWSPSSVAIETFAAATHKWASWYGNPPNGANPLFWLLWQWFSSSRLNQLIAGLLISMIAIATLILRNLKQHLRQGELWILAIAISGVAFFMLMSPVLRFNFPYLILLPALWLAHFCQRNDTRIDCKDTARNDGQRTISAAAKTITHFSGVRPPWGAHSRKMSVQWFLHHYLGRHLSALVKVRRQLPSSIAPFLVLLPLSFSLCLSIHFSLQHPTQLLMPLPMKSPVVVPQRTNDITYLVPQNDLCWATPLPCAFKVPADVRLRDVDRGIVGGFVRLHSGDNHP